MKITGPVWALGAMSGTSMDGVDAALLRTDGHEIAAFGDSGYLKFTEAQRASLRAAQGAWPGDPGVAEAAEVIETAHAELLSRFPADLVGFHGQTLAHDPQGRGTHQAGDGDVLAQVLGLPVVWDFRSTDVRMGGQGAPLAPFFHFACARWIKAQDPVVFLNLGGVGNMTWVDPNCATPEADGACLAFDTGPANAPMDDLMQTRPSLARLGLGCDRDGAVAASGQVNEARVAQFMENGYFLKMPPKSLDRNAFTALPAMVADLSDPDAMATLAAITVASVARGMEHCPTPPAQVLVCGGGRRNPVLMAGLQAALTAKVRPVEAVGLDGDMLEAQAFAYLAVRVARGLPTSARGTTGVPAAVGGGKISTPNAA